MTLQEMDAPALGVEERRDEAPRAGASHARPTPDPEVVAKPKRRKFTAQYRLRILEEAESCTQPGEAGAAVDDFNVLAHAAATTMTAGAWPVRLGPIEPSGVRMRIVWSAPARARRITGGPPCGLKQFQMN